MPKSDLPPLAQTNYSNKTRKTVHTPMRHSVHNLLTSSVHNLMTLTVHEVLTLYTNYADTRYQLPRIDRQASKAARATDISFSNPQPDCVLPIGTAPEIHRNKLTHRQPREKDK